MDAPPVPPPATNETMTNAPGAVAVTMTVLAVVIVAALVLSPASPVRDLLGPTGDSFSVIRPGEMLSHVDARTLAGLDVVVDFASDTPTVLYVFAASCGWCAANYHNILALASVPSDRYRFVGVAHDEGDGDALEEHLRDYPLPFDVFVLADADRPAFRTTPQTVVVGTHGVVDHSFPGAFTGRMLAYAEYVFGVRLPGLKVGPEPPAPNAVFP